MSGDECAPPSLCKGTVGTAPVTRGAEWRAEAHFQPPPNLEIKKCILRNRNGLCAHGCHAHSPEASPPGAQCPVRMLGSAGAPKTQPGQPRSELGEHLVTHSAPGAATPARPMPLPPTAPERGKLEDRRARGPLQICSHRWRRRPAEDTHLFRPTSVPHTLPPGSRASLVSTPTPWRSPFSTGRNSKTVQVTPKAQPPSEETRARKQPLGPLPT